MPEFGGQSKKALESAHPKLRKLFEEVVKTYDCAVICGFRNEEDQEKAYVQGFSKVKFPDSKHNSYPSGAVDVVPWPERWSDREKLYHFAGYVKRVAENLGIKVRWGGDWKSDGNLKNETFIDLPHWELVDALP